MRRIQSALRTHRQVLGFLLVGGVSYLIDTSLLMLVTGPLGRDAWLGGTVGYWVSLVFNFCMNRLVFGAARNRVMKHGIRYALLLCVNYVVTVTVLHAAEATGQNLVLVKTLLVALISVWNYFIYKNWIFR